ncbi:hypothetical protein PRIPAC_78066 [Pristionchus pacificus]|uniref:Uncharacterized protein n=1 Tax=Pristionchus pacificus TaxID=54126 RepID=A0A2A6CPE7_PRIPA|nr:hypothetical protein PRIPAC_78066 [Pristionchus pacificus]|eukprot:PDM80009.1 hypothetical protein PRIPAC_32588 [Pristionchus pacificus]
MTPTGNRKRLAKKVDVIDLSDDDSDGKQPLAKRQSLPGPSPPAASPKEVELQEKVAKLEDMYKRAVIATGQERAARYAAEGLLDSKRGILENEKNEVEKEMGSRLAELSKQLDDARSLLTKKVLELNGELDDTRRKMEEQICEKEVLSRENTALKEELDEANGISNRRQETIDKLKGELAAIKKQFEAATAQRELPTKGKLAQSNGQQPEQQNSFEKKLKKKKAKTNKTQDDSIRSTDQKDNSSIDLFEQGLLLSNQTISFDEARMKIMHKFKTTVILSWPRIGSLLIAELEKELNNLKIAHENEKKQIDPLSYMTPTGNRKRLAKKVDVIDLSDDDSDGKQPLAKRQSLPGPSPPAASPKEVELQEKVAKLEDMYKRAVIATGQERAARYAAEGLLDSKRGILENEKNEVEKEMGSRLAELSKQLDDARSLLTKKVLELNGELDDTRRKMEEQICEKEVLSRENTALKEELDEANGISNRRQETIDKLKGELAAIKKQFEAATAQRELPTKGKLAQSNGQQPEQQNSFEKKLKKKKAKTNKTQDDSIRSTDQKDNSSIDLFEQGLLLSNQTISFDEARMKIMHKFKTTVILSWPRIGSLLIAELEKELNNLKIAHENEKKQIDPLSYDLFDEGKGYVKDDSINIAIEFKAFPTN